MGKKIKIGLIALISLIILAGVTIVNEQKLDMISINEINNQTQSLEEGFGIYHLETGKLLISDKDIIAYNKNTHSIKLTEEAVKRLRSYVPYKTMTLNDSAYTIPKLGGLYQKSFVVKLNGERLYEGIFWSSVSSSSYSRIVIIDVLLITNEDHIQIVAGYPDSSYFKGIDPRRNSKIFDHFQKAGKLIH